MERNRTGDQSQFEIAFPVGTHNQLLWFSVYACAAVCRGKDAVFMSAAFIARAGCEPSRPSRARAFLIAACGGAVSSREGKEPRTTPGGAGDGAGDGGQARISRALPVEAIGDDGDGVALALIVANEHRAGLEAALWRAAVPRQPVQEPQAFPIKPAKGPLLQAISDHSPQEVLAQICWRGSSEGHAPVSPKRVKRKRAQMSNLGLDRGRVCRVPPHAYALGTLVASAEALPATIR